MSRVGSFRASSNSLLPTLGLGFRRISIWDPSREGGTGGQEIDEAKVSVAVEDSILVGAFIEHFLRLGSAHGIRDSKSPAWDEKLVFAEAEVRRCGVSSTLASQRSGQPLRNRFCWIHRTYCRCDAAPSSGFRPFYALYLNMKTKVKQAA